MTPASAAPMSEPTNEDAYEFASPQPCPLDTAGSVQLDTATLEDGDHTVDVAVEDAAGNVDVVSSRVIATHNAPISTANPALNGVTKVGTQLATSTGQWDGAPTGYGYRWLRCDADGSGCAGIPGADGPNYVPTSADAYHRLVAEVTAANHSGAATARSAASSPVADAAGHTTPPAGGGGSGSNPGVGGVAGLTNPLGQLSGHVPNGAQPIGRPRLEISFQLANGHGATHVRSVHDRRWTIAGRLLDGNGARDRGRAHRRGAEGRRPRLGRATARSAAGTAALSATRSHPGRAAT